MVDPKHACIPLPCPFCREIENLLEISKGEINQEGILKAVICRTCGANGPWVYVLEGGYPKPAYDAWNQRFKED